MRKTHSPIVHMPSLTAPFQLLGDSVCQQGEGSSNRLGRKEGPPFGPHHEIDPRGHPFGLSPKRLANPTFPAVADDRIADPSRNREPKTWALQPVKAAANNEHLVSCESVLGVNSVEIELFSNSLICAECLGLRHR